MAYLYHGAPDPMQGSILMPLNSMKATLPDIYKLHIAKYEGREEILERRIKLLDCLWNDVIQLLPVHPRKIFQLQKDLGLIDEVPTYKFFEIDPGLLDPTKTVVYFKTAPGEENTETKWLSEVNLEDLDVIPEATFKYYQSLVGSGELPFNYQFIPHVVYRGTIDITDVPVIALEEVTYG